MYILEMIATVIVLSVVVLGLLVVALNVLLGGDRWR
jgi:hypothetical protein